MDETALMTVRCWFGDTGAAVIELPDGWLGNDRHRLTWSEQGPDRLVIELDGLVVLTFDRAETVAPVDSSLLVTHFQRLVVDVRGWRGIPPERRTYDAGQVTFRPVALGDRRHVRQTGGVNERVWAS